MTTTRPSGSFPTFAELDARLRRIVPPDARTGTPRAWPDNVVRTASLDGRLSVSAGRFGKHISILGSRAGQVGTETLCRLTRLPRGETLYAISCDRPFDAADGAAAWPDRAERLGLGRHPHGIAPDGTAWFVVTAAGMLSGRSFARQGLPHDWETLPQSTRPSFDEWLASAAETPVPRLADLVADVPRLLAADIRNVVEAEVQLLWRLNLRHPIRTEELPLHVVLPPTSFAPSRRLLVKVSLHDRASRAAFGLAAGDANRHLHVRAREDGDVGGAGLAWKTAEDAIAGILAWAIASVPIPGPD